MSNEFSRRSTSHFTELWPGGTGNVVLSRRETVSIRGATFDSIVEEHMGDEVS